MVKKKQRDNTHEAIDKLHKALGYAITDEELNNSMVKARIASQIVVMNPLYCAVFAGTQHWIPALFFWFSYLIGLLYTKSMLGRAKKRMMYLRLVNSGKQASTQWDHLKTD